LALNFINFRMYSPIKITPLGAGQEVGRSCIVCKIKDKTIIFDSGIHMQYTDMEKYPDFRYICGEDNINNHVDVVIITHFHLDHCGGLPYLT
jgi:integrator complex subunit 11